MGNDSSGSTPRDDWSRLPDREGVYVFTRIYAALSEDKDVNIEEYYGTAFRQAADGYKSAYTAWQEQNSAETIPTTRAVMYSQAASP